MTFTGSTALPLINNALHYILFVEAEALAWGKKKPCSVISIPIVVGYDVLLRFAHVLKMNTQNVGMLDFFLIIVQKCLHKNGKIHCRVYLDTVM